MNNMFKVINPPNIGKIFEYRNKSTLTINKYFIVKIDNQFHLFESKKNNVVTITKSSNIDIILLDFVHPDWCYYNNKPCCKELTYVNSGDVITSNDGYKIVLEKTVSWNATIQFDNGELRPIDKFNIIGDNITMDDVQKEMLSQGLPFFFEE